MLRYIGIFITFFRIETRLACTVILGFWRLLRKFILMRWDLYLAVAAKEITDTSIVPSTASDSPLGARHSEGHTDDHPGSSSPPAIQPASLRPLMLILLVYLYWKWGWAWGSIPATGWSGENCRWSPGWEKIQEICRRRRRRSERLGSIVSCELGVRLDRPQPHDWGGFMSTPPVMKLLEIWE